MEKTSFKRYSQFRTLVVVLYSEYFQISRKKHREKGQDFELISLYSLFVNLTYYKYLLFHFTPSKIVKSNHF